MKNMSFIHTSSYRSAHIILTIMIITASCHLLVACNVSDKPDDESNMDDHSQTLLDLFYGMERTEDGYYSDSRLDTIQGLLHREFSEMWCRKDDSVKFELNIGVYLDAEYPNDTVKKAMLSKINKVIPEGFEYDLTNNLQTEILKRGANVNQSTSQFLDQWQQIFDQVTSLNKVKDDTSSYHEIIASRGCTVCHKIYEDNIWATYLLEESVDYHSSCGCPSHADYFSINKMDGSIFNLSDVLKHNDILNLENLIYYSYCLESHSSNSLTGKKLISKMDGVAIVSEGILVYFHPYNIGCGAEGQYNLIISKHCI